MEEDIFIPMGQLNELRTKAIQQLENLRISRWKRKPLKTLTILRIRRKGRTGSRKNYSRKSSDTSYALGFRIFP